MSAGRVAVIGAGTMGHGIAYAAALAGFEVRLTDSKPEALRLAMGRLNDLLAIAVKRGKLTEEDRDVAASRLRAESDFAPAVREAEVVIEAVREHLGTKQQVFAEIERAAPAGALLATNTSSLSVAAIAATEREDVLVASKAPAGAARSISAKTCCLVPRCSRTASITTSASRTAGAKSDSARSRLAATSRSSSVSLPRFTAIASRSFRRPMASRSASGLLSVRRTSNPASAAA